MFGSTVTAKIYIPPVVLFLKAQLLHARGKHVKTLFPLRASYYFAYARDKQIHCGNGFAVVVKAHVKRLYLFGVINHEYRLFINFFRQIALVLGLKVCAPVNGILEFLTRFQQNIHRLGIGNFGVIRTFKKIKTLQKRFVHEFVEKLQLRLAIC